MLMSSNDYTKGFRKYPSPHELFFSTDHDWRYPRSGTWRRIHIDLSRPLPDERCVRQRHNNVTTSMESWTFYTTGEVPIPLLRRIWIKYKTGRVLIRIGGAMGCLAATNSRDKTLRIDFRDKKISLSRALCISDRPRMHRMRLVKNSAGFYFIKGNYTHD